MLKYFFLIFAFVIILVVSVLGFRGEKTEQTPMEIFPDMDRQPKVKAQVPSDFFPDGRGAREPVAGTVPLGYNMPLYKPVDGEVASAPGPYNAMIFGGAPDYFDTGKIDGAWGTGMPIPATSELLARGKERYGIFCAVCHGATGAGNGMAQKFGVATVVSLHQDRLRTMADGEIYNTITNGKNTMFGYGDKIPVHDRWAIVAYLRALQLSQGGATIDDVPTEQRAKLEAAQ